MEIKIETKSTSINLECSILAKSILSWLNYLEVETSKIYDISKENLIFPNVLKKSKYFNEIQNITFEFIDNYHNFKSLLIKSFSEKEVKDNLKYLIPINTKTEVCINIFNNKTEKFLNFLLNHKLEELKEIWEKILEQVKNNNGIDIKNIKVSDKRDVKFQNYIEDLTFIEESEDELWLFEWIEDEDRVNIIFEWDLEEYICASIIFENSKKDWISYDEALEIVSEMDNSDKEVLMKLYFDEKENNLNHSSVMFEYLVDFWTYLEIQKNMSFSKNTWQWFTAIHWYDYPESLELEWIQNFKNKYDNLMTKSTVLSKKIAKEDEELMQYFWTLWHLTRITQELSPKEILEIFNNSSEWSGSYKRLLLESCKQLKKLSPILWRFIKIKD